MDQNLYDTDGELKSTFRVAANSLAIFYKDATAQSKKSYDAGYEQALQDVWEFLSLQNADESIQVSTLLAFIQSRHNEVPTTPLQAPSLSTFEPAFSQQIPQLSENLAHVNGGSKRRWGFNEALSARQPEQEQNAQTIEHTAKRLRKNDMSD